MPSKKKAKKVSTAPIEISFTFTPSTDGPITITYAGTDPRTYAVGDAVIDVIADSYGFAVEEIFKGDVRA